MLRKGAPAPLWLLCAAAFMVVADGPGYSAMWTGAACAVAVLALAGPLALPRRVAAATRA